MLYFCKLWLILGHVLIFVDKISTDNVATATTVAYYYVYMTVQYKLITYSILWQIRKVVNKGDNSPPLSLSSLCYPVERKTVKEMHQSD